MKIAIIGAGLTGVTLARELNNLDYQITVFEKSRGLGGRMSTKRLDWAAIDFGAQYFTARHESFKAEVAAWQGAGVVAPWDFTPFVIQSASLVASPDDQTRYVGVPGMNSMTHIIADKLNVALHTEICNIEKTPRGWQLKTCADQWYHEYFDWVVCTSPVEQSRMLFSDSKIQEAIPSSVHSPCWALALATTGKVDPEIQAVFGDNVVSWLSRLSSRPGMKPIEDADDLWMLHYSSEWSAQNDQYTSIDIVQEGMNWLTQLLSEHTSSPLKLERHFKHYWRYARLDNDAISPPAIIDHENRMAVIGSWSHGGRVEGAYLSALEFVEEFSSKQQ